MTPQTSDSARARTASLPSLVFLTGFMASGKSTVAPVLARRLGYGWVDVDAEVERAVGRSIPELFAEGGAGPFRAAEADALDRLLQRERLVIATGGGALVQARAMNKAQEAGTVVWLRVSPEVAARRLAATDLAERPMLHDEYGSPLRGAALAARIGGLMRQREKAYARADLHVDGDGPPEAVAVRILEALERRATAA